MASYGDIFEKVRGRGKGSVSPEIKQCIAVYTFNHPSSIPIYSSLYTHNVGQYVSRNSYSIFLPNTTFFGGVRLLSV